MQAFGKYNLLGRLGEGGMGIVYRARQPDLDRDIALKVLTVPPDATETAFARFRREAQLVARLRHPNIVAVHEAGEIEGHPYFTMDLIEGESLRERLARGPMPVAEALRIVREVALALEHAHERGVVHRDIKPGNVLLEGSRVIVTDFGLARISDPDVTRLTIEGDLLGTPAYMAPEQARLGGVIDARTDVYGLGALLYQLLTGTAPFAGENPFVVVDAVLNQDPPAPRKSRPDLPSDAETICLRAMEKEPSRRYPSAAAMRADIDRFQAGDAILAKPPSLIGRLRRRARRHPAVTALLALLVLVLAGASAMGIRQARHAAVVREATRLAEEAGRLYVQGDTARAESYARDALAAVPDYPRARFWLGRLALRRYAEARRLPAAAVLRGFLEFIPAPEDAAARAEIEREMAGLDIEFARGVLRLLAGDATGAIESLSTEEDAEALFHLGVAHYYAREFAQARGILDRVRASGLRPPEVERAWALADHAQALEGALRGEAPDFERSLRVLAAIPNPGPLDRAAETVILASYADYLVEHGESDRAITVLEGRTETEARLARARAFVARGRAEEALAELNAAIEGADSAWIEAEARKVRGFRRLSRRTDGWREDYERAEDLYARVPASQAAIAGRLDCRLAMAVQTEDPVPELERLAEEAGALLDGRDDLPLVEDFRAGVFDAIGREFLTETTRGREAFDEARAAYDRLLERHPGWAEIWENRATTLLNRGSVEMMAGGDPDPFYDAALESAQEAVEANPESYTAWDTRASVLLNRAIWETDPEAAREGYAEADRAFARAVQVNPEAADSWVGRAEVRSAEAEEFVDEAAWRDARAHIARALDVDPGRVTTRVAAARLAVQEMLLPFEGIDAEESARRVFEMTGDEVVMGTAAAEAHKLRGVALNNLGFARSRSGGSGLEAWRESAEELEASITEREGDFRTWLELGKVRFTLWTQDRDEGQADAAEAAFTRSLEINGAEWRAWERRGELRRQRAMAGAPDADLMEASVADFEQAYSRAPRLERTRMGLLSSLFTLGSIRIHLGGEEVDAPLGRCIALAQEFILEDPTVPQWRRLRGMARLNLAIAREPRGEPIVELLRGAEPDLVAGLEDPNFPRGVIEGMLDTCRQMLAESDF